MARGQERRRGRLLRYRQRYEQRGQRLRQRAHRVRRCGSPFVVWRFFAAENSRNSQRAFGGLSRASGELCEGREVVARATKGCRQLGFGAPKIAPVCEVARALELFFVV